MPQPTDVSTQWHQVVDSMGRAFQILPQQHWHSCFAACLCMAFLQIKGRRPPEALGRLAAGYGGRGGSDEQHRTWDVTGVTPQILVGGVKQMGLAADLLKPTRNTLTYDCSVVKPGIAITYWNAGGGHATLCLGAIPSTTRVLFLDPWYGIQEIEHTALPTYRPVDVWRTRGETNIGTFQGDVLLCHA